MKDSDFCIGCGCILSDSEKKKGGCKRCGEEWEIRECDFCGESIPVEAGRYDTEKEDMPFTCSHCDDGLPF